jgi:hypothetical protein
MLKSVVCRNQSSGNRSLSLDSEKPPFMKPDKLSQRMAIPRPVNYAPRNPVENIPADH